MLTLSICSSCVFWRVRQTRQDCQTCAALGVSLKFYPLYKKKLNGFGGKQP